MSATSEYSRSNLQAERSKCNKHETIPYTFPSGLVGTTFGVGDVGILHNLALLFKMKNIDKKYHNTISRFHIISRTMRRSQEWDWVKPEHINLVLGILQEIHENFDEVVASFKQVQAFQLEKMEEDVASGVMSEGDYIDMAKGMKMPRDFICDPDFKRWVAGRAEFYQALNGEMPIVKVVQHPEFNKNDGKILCVSSVAIDDAVQHFKQNKLSNADIIRREIDRMF